ncbi:MAG TPA: hypothetical protein VFR10_05600, partial [bacterium]|nr:hypothetical protein [bacterium]
EEHVDRWCTVHAVPRRPLISLAQLWELADAWYANRLTPEARRPMGAEITAIFQKIGLTDPFWKT